jgi:hypothetical protein
VAEILSSEDAEKVFQEFAIKCGKVPADIQRVANIDGEGNAKDGGVSKAGREFATEMPELFERYRKSTDKIVGGLMRKIFSEAGDASKGKDGNDGDDDSGVTVTELPLSAVLAALGGRRQSATADSMAAAMKGWPALVVGLGLAGPIRAAIRAAAQALTVALDDGASDDAEGVSTGVFTDRLSRAENGDRRLSVTLGAEPFVLARATRGVDDEETQAAVIMGGMGLGHGKGMLICPEQLLEAAESGAGFMVDNLDRAGAPMIIGCVVAAERDETDEPQAGSGNGPRTEDPYGNRKNGSASRPAPKSGSGDDEDLPPEPVRPAAAPSREGDPSSDGE